MAYGPLPIFPPSPGAFGAETSPYTSVAATSTSEGTVTTLPVGWFSGLNGAHNTLQVALGTTAISTSNTTLAAASAVWGPIFSDGQNFSIVNDTTGGTATHYWGFRGGDAG